MARSSLAYIPDFSVKFFFQPIYTDYANKKNFKKNTRTYAKLLLAMYLQLKFELILTYTKAAMDN
jgi:hypothetical protein